MRFFVLFLVAVAGIIALGFFRPPNIDEEPNELKISVFSPYPEEDSQTSRLVRLRPDVPTICELGTSDLEGNEILNINVFFDYRGTVDVMSDEIQLSVDKDEGVFYADKDPKMNSASRNGRRYGYEFHINDDGYIAFRPIGSRGGSLELDEKNGLPRRFIHEVGHEYYATVRAFADPFLTEPTETVTLKFVRTNDWGEFTIELIE